MQELNLAEVQEVSGGNPFLLGIIVGLLLAKK
jgi:hypothetical protein